MFHEAAFPILATRGGRGGGGGWGNESIKFNISNYTRSFSMVLFSPTGNTESKGDFFFISFVVSSRSVEKRAQILAVFQGAKLCVAFSILFKNHSS